MDRVDPGARKGFLLTLDSGPRVFLGPVLPEDRWRLVDGLDQLSPASRYLRFFTGLKQFAPRQIRYFTHVDQVDHVAWGALDPSRPRWPGVALARFVRLQNEPDVAEFALVVVDAWQRRGLGTLLLAVLTIEARRRHIRLLRGLVLPENRPVCRWTAALGARISTGPELCTIELCVAAEPPDTPQARRLGAALDRVSQIPCPVTGPSR